MSFKSIFAFLIAGAVLVFGVLGTGDPSRFFDKQAIWIVLGGTIAAGSISFEVDRMLVLFKIFFRRVILRKRENFEALIKQLMELAELYRNNPAAFAARVNQSEDNFLKEALSAISDDILDHESLIRVLSARVETVYQRQSEDVINFKAVGKYPPAFGLLGTTLSMINLLSKLGDPGEQTHLGPAMAVGLVATFYGLGLANLIFIPISESLADSTRRNRTKNQIIVEGTRLILLKTNPLILAEELNSYLLPGERVDWKVGMVKAAPAVDKKAA